MRRTRGPLPVLVGAVVAAVVASTATACGARSVAQEPGPGSPAPAGSPPLTAGAPSEGDLRPGWDQPPDGAAAIPDARLGAAALTALLRTRASQDDAPRRCDPSEVAARLSGFDAALGHRYSLLRVENTSTRRCVVAGVPGLGARGEWGSTFLPTVRHADAVSTAPVTLRPGAEAAATLEWTGELAGAGAEHLSMLVVQLAAGQVPVRVPARIAGAGPAPLDIGMQTTIEVAPFELAPPVVGPDFGQRPGSP